MKSISTQTKIDLQGNGSNSLPNLASRGTSTRMKLFKNVRCLLFARTIALVITLLLTFQLANAANYFSRAPGNWTVNTTWSLTSGGAAVGAGVFPIAGDNVTIENGNDVTVTVNAACASITFTTTTATTLTINSGITLAVSGAITIPRSGTGFNEIVVGAGILNAGSVAFTNGGLTNRHQITISTGTVTVSGNVTQTGSTGSASIIFSGAGTLNLGGAFLTDATGTLTIVAGCTVNYNGAAQTVGNFIYNNLTLSGSGAKTTTGATVNGILSMEGTATATGTVPTYGAAATLQYKGTGVQTTGTEFPATFNGSGGVIINNSNGVTLGAAKTISKLTLTSGILATSGANLLSVSGTATTAISGGSSSSFINGPVRWTLPASLVSGSTYNFPVGKGTTYLPFSLVNPTTGTGVVTAQAEAFTANTGGTFDATLTSISASEYWSLATAGNFTNSSVSVTRQTTIAPLDAIGGSTILAGQYVSLAGTAGANGVTASNAIGTNRFFVLAQKASAATTYTSVAPGGNWNTAATWSPAVVPTAGSNVIIASGAPVVLNSNTAVLINLTINGTLDVSTYTVSGTGILTVGGTASLLVGGTANFPSGFATTTTNTGSMVNYYAAGAQTISAQTYSNLTLSGSGLKTFGAGTSTVNAILSMEGTATTATSGTLAFGAASTLQYKGSGVQTTGAEFPVTFSGSGGVIINNAAGVSLGGAKIVSGLTLTSGILASTGANLLSISATSTTAVSGGSTTSFINGPVRWTLPSSLGSGSTYNFPVGKGTTYLPFSLVNPTTTTGVITAQVEAFTGNSGGTTDATLISKSTTEYWSLTTSGNFTNSSVSLTRQTAISPLDAIGGSAILAGVYNSLAGTAGANGVTGSDPIGTTRNFVLAQKAIVVPTYTSTGGGGNWNTAATWNPATVPTAGSNVVIATGSPVTVNVNTAIIGNLTINSSLDAATFTVSGTGVLTVAGTGTLIVGGTTNFPTGFSTTTLSPGSTVNYDNSGAQTVSAQTYSNLTLSGSGAKTTTGATINGILSMEGTATTTGVVPTYGAAATLQYKGTGAQTTGTEFPATFSSSGGVIINNAAGVTLGGTNTVSKLTLTAGRLTTSGANLLTVTNTGTTAISGGSTTSFINGPVKWTLPASLVSSSTYIFPIGKGTTYLPFSLVNPTTGSGIITAQAEAFTSNAGGTTDATLTSISTSEYWSLVTAGNFTNSSISLTRQTAISPLNAIGASITLTGVYTSLAGSAGTNGVTGSNAIGSNRYFVFAVKAPSSFTSVYPGGNWNNAATWNPASVPSPGSSVLIFEIAPVTVTANPVTIGDLSIEGPLNVGTFTVSGTGSLNLSATGSLLIGGANNFPTGFSSITLDDYSTVNYNSSGNQTVTNLSYGNLTLSNSGAKTLPGSPLTVNRTFTITGSATATPTVAITVVGTTTLSGNGVLTLGAANILSNTGSIILDGGTLRTGSTIGYSETVGVLNLSNSSTIALGTGVHSLTFANSSGSIWSGTTLTINGWTGTPGTSGTGGRIFFGSATGTLTDVQLAKINFAGFPGTRAVLLSTGELVPASYPVLAITGNTNHGGSCIGTAAAPITYTITNTGGTATGVTVTSDSPQFVVSGAPTTVAGGGTASYVVTFTPSGSGAQTGTITVASTTPGSNSPTSSLTGTGTDFPIAGLISSDPDNTICEGDAVTFTATGGTTYEFFVDAVSRGAASATATFTTSTLTNGQTVTVKVTNASGCSATSTGILTFVNPLPPAPTISGTPTVEVGSVTLLGSIYLGGVWTSSDPSKATVDPSSGLVTGVAVGTTTIIYTISNGSCTNSATLLMTVQLTTGLQDLEVEGLSLINYPNPFAGNTTIRYTLPKDGRVTLTIRNLAGQAVKTYVNEIEPQGEYSIEIETGDLQSGIYIATLSLKGKGNELVKTIRLVKGK